MASASFNIKDLENKMTSSLEALKREFSGLRTGRASAHLLDPIQVTVYGARTPLTQVASVSVPEPRMITVQVWDSGNVSAVEKAIRESNLGLNPVIEGSLMRLPIPTLTADRRKELVKVAHKYAEQSKVSIRNVRRDGMDLLKKSEKNGDISEDDLRSNSTKVQELTDRFVKEIDALLASKEKEIKTV